MSIPLLKKIDHINIVVENLEKVKEFFVSFGFEIHDQSRLHGEWISKIVGLKDVDAKYVKLTLPDDTTSLELLEFKNPELIKNSNPDTANVHGFRHMAFQVTDIKKAVANLEKQGIVPESDVQEYSPTKKKLVYFKGPEGILLELAQYGEN
jgi:catechol 2,3-dioxygenase-like lactoylglutathione lyase family enzyme